MFKVMVSTCYVNVEFPIEEEEFTFKGNINLSLVYYIETIVISHKVEKGLWLEYAFIRILIIIEFEKLLSI